MVGVLALQGNYQMHLNMLSSIGQNSMSVKSKNDLLKCDALIIPGGESTVISKLMIRYDLFDEIKKFSKKKSIFGTCAGLVLMANDSLKSVDTLNIIDVDILRNAWGRQIESFTKNINIDIDSKNTFKATFIRAPRIKKIAKSINVLASIDKEPVMIRQGRHLATTFHPEMHNNTLIHKYFLEIVNESR